MIARVWKCIATTEHVVDYIKHFEHSVSGELMAIDGYEGAYILQCNLNDKVELTVMTFWQSMDAIHQFAGETPDRAVVAPAAREILQSFDSTVIHYEVALRH